MKLKMLPALYGRASNGKIKIWKIEAQGWETNSNAIITTSYGYIDGQIQQTTKNAYSKNVGKSNETSPFEQAVLEATSLWNSKKDEGYVEDKSNIPKASSLDFFLPMLAQVWEKRQKYINVPAYVQPKLDGVRCLARKKNGEVYMWSRKGKSLDIPVEIKESLSHFLREGQCVDGEIYVHGWTFQRIVSAVKKYRDDTALLEYHIYDSPVLNESFESRFVNQFSQEVFQDNIVIVPTKLVESIDFAIEELERYLGAGYEGLMIRNASGLYKYKHRSNDLQKMKKFTDAEFEVIGVEEATGRDSGTAIFVCKNKNGNIFNVRPTGTLEQRAEYLENFNKKYRGKMLTVKFQDLTDDGIPRFPVGLHFRPEWDV